MEINFRIQEQNEEKFFQNRDESENPRSILWDKYTKQGNYIEQELWIAPYSRTYVIWGVDRKEY